MAELSYDSYIELDIGFSGVQIKVTAWVVKCRTFHTVVYWMFIFFQYFDCLWFHAGTF